MVLVCRSPTHSSAFPEVGAVHEDLVVVELFVRELVRGSTTTIHITYILRKAVLLCFGLKGLGAGVNTGR